MKYRNPFTRLFNEEPGDGGSGGGGSPAAAAVAAAPAPSAFNPDGSFAENWHAALGEEFSPHAEALKNFKDVKGLAKSFLHFRSTGPQYPGEASAPEDVTRFHALAQVPADGSPTAYGITLPDTASDLDKGVVERLSKVAHQAHMPAPAFRAVVAEYQKIQQEEGQKFQDAQAAAQKAAEDALVGEWRGNFETNKSTVRHLATTLATQAGIAPDSPQFEAMVNNPDFGRLMLQVSKLTQEDRISAPAGLGDLRAPAQVAEAIMEGKDPVWGQKYINGTREEKIMAAREVARLLSAAAK